MLMVALCLMLMTFMGAVASLFLKKASGSESPAKLLLNIHFYIGGILYVAAALMNIWVLRYLDYSIVLPLTSLTYVWAMALAYFILKEKISAKKAIGVCLILVGAMFVSMQV